MHKKEVIDQLEHVAQQMMELAEGLKGKGGRPLTEDEMLLVKRAMAERLEDSFKELTSMYLGGVHSDLLCDHAQDILKYYTNFGEKPDMPEPLSKYTK